MNDGTQSPSLRPALPADRDLLLAIYAGTRTEELAAVAWTDQQKDDFLRHQFDAREAHYAQTKPMCVTQIVEAGGQPVGRLSIDEQGDDIRIVDIALLPAGRGRGIGSLLLQQVIERARQSGKTVSIHVERFNRARTLYERLGFRVVEEGDVYLLMELKPAQ